MDEEKNLDVMDNDSNNADDTGEVVVNLQPRDRLSLNNIECYYFKSFARFKRWFETSTS